MITNAASQNVKVYGTSALTVFNSSVTAQVGATIEVFGTLLLYGGVVSVFRMTIVSSTFNYFGYLGCRSNSDHKFHSFLQRNCESADIRDRVRNAESIRTLI